MSAVDAATDPRLTLARLRAAGVNPAPTDPRGLATLFAAASRAGRRLVDVSPPGSLVQCVSLGWQDGSEPDASEDTGVTRLEAARELALVLAAALRCCWPDPDRHPFPGQTTTFETIMRARSALDSHSVVIDDGNGATGIQHRRAALQRLREAGYLTGSDAELRLGHQVGLWSSTQVAALRRAYDLLPRPGAAAGEAAGEADESEEVNGR